MEISNEVKGTCLFEDLLRSGGTIEELKDILSKYPEAIHYTDPSSGTLLNIAAEYGTPEIILYLANLNVDINKVGNLFSPLCDAASNGKLDNVKCLIELGAKLDASESVLNPLLYALQIGDDEIARVLIEAGIDLTPVYKTKDNPWWDTLSYARCYGRTEIAELIEKKLIEQGITPDPYVYKEEEMLAMEDYIEEHAGKISNTLEEIIPVSEVSIAVNIIEPDEKRNYYTLVTSGMSEYETAYSRKEKRDKFAELMIKLPADWKIGEEYLSDPTWNWPIILLRKVGYAAHANRWELHENLVIPNKEQKKKVPFTQDTKMNELVLEQSVEIPPLLYNEEVTIEFFTLVPIYEKEHKILRKIGVEGMINKLSKGDIVDLNREMLK